MTVRDRVVEEALRVEGLCACSATRDAFADLLGRPGGAWGWDLARPFRCRQVDGRWQTQGVSTCALVASGIMGRAGIDLPWSGKPYVSGSAISREIALARVRGAWVTGEALKWTTPQPGDIPVVGSGIGTHMLVAVDWRGHDATLELASIDGGQVCQQGTGHSPLGLQAVLRRVRPWRWLADGRPKLGDRVVLGWIDVERM